MFFPRLIVSVMKVCRGAVKLPMPYPRVSLAVPPIVIRPPLCHRHLAHPDKNIRDLKVLVWNDLQETHQSVIDLDFPFPFDFLGGAHHSHVSKPVDRNNSALKIDVLPGEPEGLRGSRYETAR